MQATFENFKHTLTLPPAERRKLMNNLARKTENEQLMIFELKKKIFSAIKTEKKEEVEQIKKIHHEQLAFYDYIILLLAIQIHNASTTKSAYITELRQARQQVKTRKTSILRAIETLIPLIDELRESGMTWQETADMITAKQKKILHNKKVSKDYLKKTYAKIKNRP